MAQASRSPNDPLSTLQIRRSSESLRRISARIRLFKWAVGLFVVAGLLAVGAMFAERRGWFSVSEALARQPEVRVGLVQVETGRASSAVVVATGYLESRRQAKIGARAPGRIERINVEEGSRVEKGQELAVLEHADLDAALTASRATVEQAKGQLGELEVQIAQFQRDFERARTLRQRGSISEEEYEHAKREYDLARARQKTLLAAISLAEARVGEAQQVRENMFVRAPFDGTVISKDAEVGESIMPGGMGEASGRGSVVTIADLEHLEVDCDVKEDYISRVQVERSAEVAVDAVPEHRYQARVRKIIPMGDRARATIKVKVEILDVDERLFPEMSATVYFLPDSHTATAPADDAGRKVLCPVEALGESGGTPFVWVVDGEDRVQRVSIDKGAVRGERVDIEAGLQGGERVVLAPPAGLKDGQRVRVVQ